MLSPCLQLKFAIVRFLLTRMILRKILLLQLRARIGSLTVCASLCIAEFNLGSCDAYLILSEHFAALAVHLVLCAVRSES